MTDAKPDRLRMVPRTAAVPEWATDRRLPVPAGVVEDAYAALLVAAERDTADRDGLADTPARAARAWRELTRGYDVDVAGVFRTFDADGYDEMVAVRAIPFYSLCEHHLLPFHGTAGVAYVPAGRIVGLSKLARLVDAFSRRLQVQERLTDQIADALVTHLAPKGVAVVVSGVHMCMTMRGAQAHGSATVTSALRGAMRTNAEARAEALALLRA